MRRIPFGLPFHKVHFSSDKEVIVKNVAQHSLVAQRVICDHVQSAGCVPQAAFCKELLLSAASGRYRYDAALDEKRRVNETARISERKKLVLEEIFTWKEKKRRLENDFKALKSSVDKYAEKPKESGKLTFIAKSNRMRKTAIEKEE